MAVCVKCNKKGIFVKVDKNNLCGSCAEKLAKEENKTRSIANENAKLAHYYATSIAENANNIVSHYENGLCKDKDTVEQSVNLAKDAVQLAREAISAVSNAPISEVISVVKEIGNKLEAMNKKSLELLSNSMNIAPKQEYEHVKFKLAGVTFKNEDGTNRQAYLRKLKFKDEPFNKKGGSATLSEYEYDGAPAFAVLVNDCELGNVPKDVAKYLNDNFERIEGITAVDVYGGGETEDGEKKNYGAEVIVKLKGK